MQGSILGPILFNLYIPQILVFVKPICVADDRYYFSLNKSKTEATIELERKLKTSKDWLKNSGMKVNFTKTEFTIFLKSLNITPRIRIGAE